MPEASEADITHIAATATSGCVVAAAGCGKTEQIAMATKITTGRRLILTHTHAGVDALRKRLNEHHIPAAKYRLDTIAGWCLRYSASFPATSGLAVPEPREDQDWEAVYICAARLISSGAINEILASSYGGAFVDEYQDCGTLQHGVIKALASRMPVCIFGDPLQAIFDFKGQKPVDWDSEVFPTFAKLGKLTTPWRWRKSENLNWANWLEATRIVLENGGAIDLRGRPDCVEWKQISTTENERRKTITGACKALLGSLGDDTLIVIGDPININARALLGKQLASAGFSCIEPINCKSLYVTAAKLDKSKGLPRLKVALAFISTCMIGAERSPYLAAIKSRQTGGRAGATKFGSLIDLGIAVTTDTSDEALLALMQGFQSRSETRLFRREMFFAMKSAIGIKISQKSDSLTDAIWQVQNRIRHTGRTFSKRSIGSTLLIKGLEFDHAVLIHSSNMTCKDLYVALTRATKGMTILSESEQIVPTV
jgi:hypothetical protein